MPVNWKNYPANWGDMARKCKVDADWKCQQCGIGHMEDGTMGTCLTVHHPDHDPGNPDARLEALCARCHLKADRAIRRNRGQEMLFGDTINPPLVGGE